MYDVCCYVAAFFYCMGLFVLERWCKAEVEVVVGVRVVNVHIEL